MSSRRSPPATPQIYVDVDRDKAQMLKVPVDQHLRGHARVHGLGLRQRLQHVRPHLSASRRRPTASTALDPESVVEASACATTGGPDGAARQPRDVQARSSGPSACRATTCSRRPRSTARRGRASARARRSRSCASSPRAKLPQGVTYEWTDLSYQEAKVGRTGYYIFVLSVIFVFLALVRAVRELVAAARHHPDRADVPVLGARSACGCTGATSTSSRRSASSC